MASAESKYNSQSLVYQQDISQSKINQPETWNQKEKEKHLRIISFENWENRICEDKPKRYFKNYCKTDNKEMLIKKRNGKLKKQKKILSVCGSPFCRSEDCFKQKYLLANLLFSTYFYSRPHYLTKRGDTWLHFSVGDERQSQYTKEDMKDFKKRCFAFYNDVEKKLNFRLKGILESDLAFDETRIGEELFNHNHGAFRPFGLSRDKKKFAQQLKDINAIARENKVMFNFIGYRSSKHLIDYFAKRHSGKFGHKAFGDKSATDFRFADIMSKEHYYKNYLGQQKIFIYGFSRKERTWIKQHQKEILINASDSATSPSLNDNRIPAIVLVYKNYLFETLICPICQGTHSFKQEISLDKHRYPPDISPNASTTPTIKVIPLGEAREHKEMKELLKQKSEENKRLQEQKRFSRWYKSETNQKFRKSDLDFADRLNLSTFGRTNPPIEGKQEREINFEFTKMLKEDLEKHGEFTEDGIFLNGINDRVRVARIKKWKNQI